MKLTRSDLIHAKDAQLAAIGIVRSGNKGWLVAALCRQYSEAEIELFQSAAKQARPTATPGRPFCGKSRLRRAKVGTPDLFEREPEQYRPCEKGPAGESAEDYANRIYSENRNEFTE